MGEETVEEKAAKVLATHWHDYDVDCEGVTDDCGAGCAGVTDIQEHQVSELAKAGLLKED